MQDLDEILELIKQGKISIRQASEQTGYGRDFLKSSLIKKYGETAENLHEIQELMDSNKANSTTKHLDEKLLEILFVKVVNGEVTLESAQEELGGVDKETLRNKFLEFVKNSHSPEAIQKYREYQAKKQGIDHSDINFRAVAIYMIRNNKSQSEVAEEMFISPRTISREFEKFKDDEDVTLYTIIKAYSDKKMKKTEPMPAQMQSWWRALEEYEFRHPDLLFEGKKSKTDLKNEKMQNLVFEAERLKQEGLSQAEIAKRLGTSISGLRRARIFVEQQNIVNSKPTEQALNGVGEEPKPTDEDGR